MKRLSLVIVLVCCAMDMAAQVECNVKYQGAQPTISDFVQAMVSARHEAEEEDDCQDDAQIVQEGEHYAVFNGGDDF